VRRNTNTDSKPDTDTDPNRDSQPHADTDPNRAIDAVCDTDTNCSSDGNPDARADVHAFAGAGVPFQPPGRACRRYPAPGRPWHSWRCRVSECGDQHGNRRG
jgi:hypothetical protein